jgi:hypothetical protein
MVWSQYADYARVVSDPDELSEEEELPRNRIIEFDEWITWYSNDILNMWLGLKAYRETCGNGNYILDKVDYGDFCEFCYRFSCGLSSRLPS